MYMINVDKNVYGFEDKMVSGGVFYLKSDILQFYVNDYKNSYHNNSAVVGGIYYCDGCILTI